MSEPKKNAFDVAFESLKGEALQLATTSLADFKEDALTDTTVFLDAMKGKMEKWTAMLERGELDQEEYNWLLQSQKDLLHLSVLKQKGIQLARIAEFRSGVMNIAFNVLVQSIMGKESNTDTASNTSSENSKEDIQEAPPTSEV